MLSQSEAGDKETPPRLLVDAMLGRLARWLRLMGYDAAYYRAGSDEELARLAGDIATTIFHPVGTTKMGPDNDRMAVLDSRLRVRGIHGLRVVDAGAMPTITSGNTNSPTLMMAEKAAGWIVDDASRSAAVTTAGSVAVAPQ